MKRFWKLMGRYDAETTTYTAVAGTNGASPYNPDFDGRLRALRCLDGGGAATSLLNMVQWKLTCTIWKPNAIEAGLMGGGIQTAPAMKVGIQDWPVDQPIQRNTSITIEARHLDADTPVSVDCSIWGLFEVSD